MIEYMITTTDNPYSPFTQFNEWRAHDQWLGYNTPSYLARVVRSSDELSEADQTLAIEQGIDDIIRDDILGVYIKVSSENLGTPGQ